jgi:hypothetical protein
MAPSSDSSVGAGGWPLEPICRGAGFRRASLAAVIAAIVWPGLACPDDQVATSPRSGPSWDVGASVLLYALPEDASYFQPTVTVDHGLLHLEARYNYEARETGSAWIGVNFSFGEDLRFGLTPMVGGVFGRTKGIATGLTITLEWGPLALWSQSEYVFDLADSSNDYFYVWSELAVTGPEWLRIGMVLQRTKVFETSTQVQGGPLVGVTFWKLSATAYLFAPAQPEQFVVVALAGSF